VILRGAGSILLWALMLLLTMPLWVAGILVCSVLAYRRDWWPATSSVYVSRTIMIWRPRWAWLWSNDEDGVTGNSAWRLKYANRERLGALLWSAWRNPTNNFRFVPVLNPVIEPRRIRFVGNTDDPHPSYTVEDTAKPGDVDWAFTWQGIYSGLIWRWQITASRHCQFRIGWKLLPRDRFGVPDWDHRRVRCGFGFQFHAWRGG